MAALDRGRLSGRPQPSACSDCRRWSSSAMASQAARTGWSSHPGIGSPTRSRTIPSDAFLAAKVTSSTPRLLTRAYRRFRESGKQPLRRPMELAELLAQPGRRVPHQVLVAEHGQHAGVLRMRTAGLGDQQAPLDVGLNRVEDLDHLRELRLKAPHRANSGRREQGIAGSEAVVDRTRRRSQCRGDIHGGCPPVRMGRRGCGRAAERCAHSWTQPGAFSRLTAS